MSVDPKTILIRKSWSTLKSCLHHKNLFQIDKEKPILQFRHRIVGKFDQAIVYLHQKHVYGATLCLQLELRLQLLPTEHLSFFFGRLATATEWLEFLKMLWKSHMLRVLPVETPMVLLLL